MQQKVLSTIECLWHHSFGFLQLLRENAAISELLYLSKRFELKIQIFLLFAGCFKQHWWLSAQCSNTVPIWKFWLTPDNQTFIIITSCKQWKTMNLNKCIHFQNICESPWITPLNNYTNSSCKTKSCAVHIGKVLLGCPIIFKKFFIKRANMADTNDCWYI